MANDHPAYQQKTDQLTVPHCLELLVHACQCNVIPCQLRDCKQMKEAVTHVKSCSNRLSGNCTICENLVFLCSNHTRNHREGVCAIPLGNDASQGSHRDQHHQGYANAAVAMEMPMYNIAPCVERAQNKEAEPAGVHRAGNQMVKPKGVAADVQQPMYQPQIVQQSNIASRMLPNQQQQSIHLGISQKVPEQPPVNVNPNILGYSEKFLQTLPPHRYAVFKRFRDRMDVLRSRQTLPSSEGRSIPNQQETWSMQQRPSQVLMTQRLSEQPSNANQNACYPSENEQQNCSPRQTTRLKRLRDRMNAYRSLQELRKQQYIQRLNNPDQIVPNKQHRSSNIQHKQQPSQLESSSANQVEPSRFDFDSLIEPSRVKEENLVDLIAFDLDGLLGTNVVEQNQVGTIPLNIKVEPNDAYPQKPVDSAPIKQENREFNTFKYSPDFKNESVNQREGFQAQSINNTHRVASNSQQHEPRIEQDFDQDILDDLEEILQMLPEDS